MTLLDKQVESLQAQFQKAGERVVALTKFSRKNSGEVILSYFEELGELCQEIKIHTGVAGTQHKKPGPDGIYGECADVWICAVSYCSLKQQEVNVNLAVGMIDEKEFTDFAENHVLNTAQMQEYVMALALKFDPDPICFLNKINAKVDKWCKNVNFMV